VGNFHLNQINCIESETFIRGQQFVHELLSSTLYLEDLLDVLETCVS